MFYGLIESIWNTFTDAGIYILFGIFLSGIIQIFIQPDQIGKYLGKPGFKSVLWASLLGIPLPLCSCGVIPTAISLRKNGASKGSVLSFLISTPETGIDSITVSFGLLDPIMAVFRPIAAFITAIIAGIMENLFGLKEKTPDPEACPHCRYCEHDENEEAVIEAHPHLHSYFEKIKKGMNYAFIELLGEITKWLIFGISLAGIISYFIPPAFIEKHLGTGIQPMFVMLLAGIPLYICASASTPIAAAFIAKGMSPGVALVFLLSGPATNAATILNVAKFLGKRSAVIYLLSISVCSLLLGWLLNYIYFFTGLDIHKTLGQAGHHLCSHRYKTAAAIVLLVLMANGVYRLNRIRK
jgi:uncharacterized protein